MNLLPSALRRPLTGTIAGYALAVLLFLIGLAARKAADGMLPPGFPFLTFFPAVIFATFIGGRGPGTVCALLSGWASWYFFIAPSHAFAVNLPVVTAMLFYAFVVAVDIWLIHSLQVRQQQLEASQRRLAAMAEHQTLLFKELQHRVANNLASVASMLRLQRRQIQKDPASAVALIDRADERIELMGRIHRQLYDPISIELPVSQHLQRAVDQAREVVAASGVTVSVSVDEVELEISRLMSLVLLVTEIITNSFKHAFPDGKGADGDGPTVSVNLNRVEGSKLRLTISDNGHGFDPARTAAPGQRSLGTAIIRGFVVQLGGTMETRSVKGVTTTVDFAER